MSRLESRQMLDSIFRLQDIYEVAAVYIHERNGERNEFQNTKDNKRQ